MYKLVDGTYVEYSDAELRRDNPHTIFPRTMTDEVRERFGAVIPQEGTRGENQVFDGVSLVNGALTKQWRDKTTQEIRAERDSLRVSRTQGLIALANAGIWESTVLAVIDAYTEPQRTKARAYFANDTWRRSSPLIAQLGTALNLTESQIDDLFIAAAAIEV